MSGNYYDPNPNIANARLNFQQYDTSGFLKGGQAVNESLNYLRDKELSDFKIQKEIEKEKYQRSRDALSDARYDKQELRKDKEQQATDSFYNSMAEGPKQVGGLYGDTLAKESDKYVMTQDEIASGIMNPEEARKSGNEALAKKLEWQLKAGDAANKAVTADAFKESRPEMYLRMMEESRSKGLPVLPGMVEKYESAKLAEETASAKKLEDITKLKEDIYKDQLSNQWKLVGTIPNKDGSVQTGTDSDGNPIYIPTLKQQVNSQNKANKTFDEQVADDTKILNSVFDDIKKDGKPVVLEKGTSDAIRSDMSKAYINARNNYPDVDPSVIAKAVASTAGSTSGGYLWGDPAAKYNVEELNNKLKDSSYIKSETDKIKAQQQVALQNSGTDVEDRLTKFDMAKELVSGTNAINANRLSGINSKMAQLNLTPEERRLAKAQEWLKSEGLISTPSSSLAQQDSQVNRLANINKELTDPKKLIAGVPNSLKMIEGISNSSYGDAGGYAVGMGYNLTKNIDSIDRDFKNANISPEKAYIARTRPQDLVLDNGEAERLAQVAVIDRIDRLDNKIAGYGKTFDTLSPNMQAAALQMEYRGDLGNKDYSKQLKGFIRKDDFEGLKNYIVENQNTLPKEVVDRFGKNLKYDTGESLSRGTMTDKDKDIYLANARLSSKSEDEKAKSLNNLDSKSIPKEEQKIKDYSELKNEIINRTDVLGNEIGSFDENIIKNKIMDSNDVNSYEADKIFQNIKKDISSQYSSADKNYREALQKDIKSGKQNSTIINGKNAEEWYKLRSEKSIIGDNIINNIKSSTNRLKDYYSYD